ncbi:SymE family type I addiction module toxin [uncultured Clostridium sp.]|uniref:SymE family type I addiction module toxin n=1 Tax=uncultured Clostridium sp. TaxID=59620 RepID=UPI0025D17D0D|nr:SymE family type I addiction module toxin [uncultured Clostridium sp.]
MAFKEKREVKVYEMSGWDYKTTSTIMLKGQWLKELGFVTGEKMDVQCEGSKLTITLKNEWAAE